ncbi:MAG TPA: glycosyltransferase family 1 protein [Actinomycetota bacterium]|nr:glycosyltransferase family 1 protein [Actinomycetota bacterium]
MNRVAINLLWMVPGVVGGSETYTVRLLHGLAERSSELDYTLFALPQFASAHPELARTFRTVYAPMRGQLKPARVLAGEAGWMTIQAKRLKVDIIHHAGGVLPVFRHGRPLLTIHDLQYLYYPDYFTRTKLAYLRAVMPRSAEAARLIITPSEYSRRTVIERLNIDPTIVTVVPHGISRKEELEPAADIRERYNLAEKFFVYPAASYPHKNHLVLVEAFASLRETHADVTLVFTGAKGSMQWGTAKSMESRLAEEVRNRGLKDHVRSLGYVPAADLEALYREAVALVFPSRFEGFGAPVLEAMARGCPVIAADATALPEVVHDAGCLVSPDNADQWRNAMAELLDDEGARNAFRAAGLERARHYTWERSADMLEHAYRHVLDTTL